MTEPSTADRIARHIEELSGPGYTLAPECVRRYAFVAPFLRTLAYVRGKLEELGFQVRLDGVGNLIARNVPDGTPAFGLGSHCDSNRNGGRYDGILGVVTAIEVARLARERRLELPLQVISFVEEEGSGFGQPLLGSRIMAGDISEHDLRASLRSLDDGLSFWEHASAAGLAPESWSEAAQALQSLTGWLEMHIEQGRVLQEHRCRLGVVTGIAGQVRAEVRAEGRADHAGSTPMNLRQDAAVVAAEAVLELERLAVRAGKGTVGTVGQIRLEPGLPNVIAGHAEVSLDVRGSDDSAVEGLISGIRGFIENSASSRGMRASLSVLTRISATPLEPGLCKALEDSARATGTDLLSMTSGALHDTVMMARHVPSAMLFIPCRDGISHSPEEYADVEDAALAAEVMLAAIQRWLDR